MGSAQDQAEFWKRAARDWAEFFEPHFWPLWEVMLERANVRAGTEFFDAGCGAGGASELAAIHGAKITGLDATEDLLEIARERVPEGNFRTGDLEALPYPDASFDISFAANSIQFTYDPIQTLRELRRVTKLGGKIVFAVWPPPEQNDFGSAIAMTMTKVVGKKPRVGPFALSAPGLLEDVIEKSGAKILSDELVSCPMVYKEFEELWRTHRTPGGAQTAIATVGEDVLKEAVREAVQKFVQPSGRIHLDNQLRCVLLQA